MQAQEEGLWYQSTGWDMGCPHHDVKTTKMMIPSLVSSPWG